MANKNENVEFEYYGIFLGWQAKHKIRKIFHLFCVPLVHIYFIVAIQSKKLGDSVNTLFSELFVLFGTSLPYFSPHTSLLSFFATLKYSCIFTSAGSICNAKDILPSSEFMYFSGVMSAPLKNRLWETPYFSQ